MVGGFLGRLPPRGPGAGPRLEKRRQGRAGLLRADHALEVLAELENDLGQADRWIDVGVEPGAEGVHAGLVVGIGTEIVGAELEHQRHSSWATRAARAARRRAGSVRREAAAGGLVPRNTAIRSALAPLG